MKRVTSKRVIPLLLSPEDWKWQMDTILNVVGVRAAARINAHVAALEERIEALEAASLQTLGPGAGRVV